MILNVCTTVASEWLEKKTGSVSDGDSKSRLFLCIGVITLICVGRTCGQYWKGLVHLNLLRRLGGVARAMNIHKCA